MSENQTKTLQTLCDEARLAAAGYLLMIVEKFAEKAKGDEASVAHAKFLAELVQTPSAAEKSEKKEKTQPDSATDSTNTTVDGLTKLLTDIEEKLPN